MPSSNTFFDYYRRFLRKLFEDVADWPRDNVLVAGIAAIAPPIVLYFRRLGDPPDWRLLRTTLWIYLLLFCIYLAFHAIRIPWKLDAERVRAIKEAVDAKAASELQFAEVKLASELRIAELMRKLFDERPNLQIRVLNLSEEPRRGANIALDVQFRLCHFRGRPATSISVDPIYSFGGTYALRLGGLPFLAKEADYPVTYEVWENGQRSFSKIVNTLGWAEVLKLFIWDSKSDGDAISFPVIVRFRDGDEYREQRFRLNFDRTTYRFSTMEEYNIQ